MYKRYNSSYYEWRKIDSNYHTCNATTIDYHYQISPYYNLIIFSFTLRLIIFLFYKICLINIIILLIIIIMFLINIKRST